MGQLVVGTVWGGRLASLDPFALIWQASWIVQLVLILLAGFSIVSWAVIVFKWRELRAAQDDDDAFLEVYHEGSAQAAYEAARDLDQGPLPAIYLAAWAERVKIAKYGGTRADSPPDDTHLHQILKRLTWAASEEAGRLQARLTFLATTGSSTPFIGLFGTVIGIINSFTGIGEAGSASLAVVAPGIAEALIATGVGLFAAIPATIFYNVFMSRLREIRADIDLFTAELEGDLRRESGEPPRAVRAAEA
ncbi:MAG: MotA/TolQ/ExbB proton channel family protein [Myxococcales bacterium]|nr:MotA/TolQ/ExbB proton channel family protein [Myxococcales bacterium]